LGRRRTSKLKGEELVYAARVALDRKQMQVEDKLVNLSPGMAVTVEIKTGSRTIINYLLSPLLRYSRRACESGETSVGSCFRGRPAPALLKILTR